MNVLLFSGSPRKKGHTAELSSILVNRLAENNITVDLINCYQTPVAPCTDCRYCWKHPSCSIDDAMTEIYRKIDAADIFIFAAPVYFFSLPAPMKMIVDRLQCCWAAVKRGDSVPSDTPRYGAGILTGGAPAFPDQFSGTERVIEAVFRDLHAESLGFITLSATDRFSPGSDKSAEIEVLELAEKILETGRIIR